MAITVKIVKAGYGHLPGQVLTLNEFEAGHLIAFGYGVTFHDKAESIETQTVKPPETQSGFTPVEKPISFLRKGRRKK